MEMCVQRRTSQTLWWTELRLTSRTCGVWNLSTPSSPDRPLRGPIWRVPRSKMPWLVMWTFRNCVETLHFQRKADLIWPVNSKHSGAHCTIFYNFDIFPRNQRLIGQPLLSSDMQVSWLRFCINIQNWAPLLTTKICSWSKRAMDGYQSLICEKYGECTCRDIFH